MAGEASATTMTTKSALDFVVDKQDLRQCKFVTAEGSSEIDLQSGRYCSRRKVWVTSNNITYAVFGETMDYWSFFRRRRGGEGFRLGASGW